MKCTLVYGLGRNLTHTVDLSPEEAFRIVEHKPPEYAGYAFYNIFLRGRLVYTTQGVAGSRWICEDCPYFEKKNGTWTRIRA